MLFEHSPVVPAGAEPAGATSDEDQSDLSCAQLPADEQATLLRGLHEVDRGGRVDVLAAELVREWSRLSTEERCAALTLIAALLAAEAHSSG